MPAKMARSAPQASFGLPTVTVAVTTWLLSCRKAGKVQIFTSDGEPSGKSRLIQIPKAIRLKLNRCRAVRRAV